MKINQSGFTLIELVVVFGILLMISGLVTFSLISNQRIASVTSAIDGLVSDMSSQQTKAMLGAGASNGISYGIYFQADKYVLFQGKIYDPLDTNNFTVEIDSGLTISSILLSNPLIFSAGTGTVSAFLNGQDNSISIQDKQGTKTEALTINRYGVITEQN